MSLFSTIPCWSHALEGHFDSRAVAVFNLMRAKTNTAQIIVGSLEGRLTVLRTERTESETLTNNVFSNETESPILGLELGFFTGPSPLKDKATSKAENLELAVVHPQSIDIYTPKRLQDGDIGLELVNTVQFSRYIVSTCVITSPSPGSETSVALYHSKIAVRTDDGSLHICTRKIIATHKLGLMYSFPTPMVFCPGADLLIISSFDYTIAAFSYADIIDDTKGDVWQGYAECDVHSSANIFSDEGNPLLHTRSSGNKNDNLFRLKARWLYVIGERIQQLSYGRCFGIDSGVEGEIIVLHAHGITLINASTGLLSVENQLPNGLLFSMALFSVVPSEKENMSQPSRRRRIQLPETSSIATLDSNRMLHFFRGGELKWITKVSDSIDEPIGIYTPRCITQSFIPHDPPTVCSQNGLFIMLSRTGYIQIHMLGTRPLDGNTGPSNRLSSLLAPIIIPKQAVVKLLMEEAQKQLNTLKIEHANIRAHRSEDIIAMKCGITKFYRDGNVSYTIVEITVKDMSARLTSAILGVIGCGNQEEPITDASSFAEYLSFLPSKQIDSHTTLAGPTSSFIQLGDKECFRPVVSTTIQFRNGSSSTVYLKLGICDFSFFASPSLHVSVYADIKMVSDGHLISAPFVAKRNLSLPIFSSALVRENSALIASNSSLKISLRIVPKEPFSTLHELLLKRPFSASILSEVGRKSPNCICIMQGTHDQVAISFQNALHISAASLEVLPLGIEFLLGYKSFFQIIGIDYNADVILNALSAVYTRYLELSTALTKLNLRLGVTAELITDVMQLVSETIPRVPFSMQPIDVDFTKLVTKYSQPFYQSVLGDISFLTHTTFNQGHGILSAARCANVGEKVDALLSYYELQLHDTQKMSTNHMCALQKLKACMNVIVSIMGIGFLIRGESTEGEFEVLRHCLIDFEDASHLYYFLVHYSKKYSNSISHQHMHDFTNYATPDQFLSAIRDILAKYA